MVVMALYVVALMWYTILGSTCFVLTVHFNIAPRAAAFVDIDEPLYICNIAVRMVSVQEVPKRADRNPNATFYLWTIKHDQVGLTFRDVTVRPCSRSRISGL